MKDEIKKFDDVMKHLNMPLDYFDKYEDDKFIIAVKKIQLICNVFNGNWCPDWNEPNERKYYPWFDMRTTGASHDCGRTTTNPSLGFAFVRTFHDNSDTSVGSRLCFKNREDCEYAAKQFIDIYYDFFVWNVRIDNIKNILK